MAGNTLQLTIIVPVYTAEKYLADCLTSLVTQDLPVDAYEIVCVNDGSSDSSVAIVERFQENHKNIRLLNQENGGVAVARNTGLRNAAGKYIMFVDSDDFIAANCLGKLIKEAEDRSADLLTFSYSCIDENKTFSADVQLNISFESTFVRNATAPFQVWGILYRAEIIKLSGLQFEQEFRTREDYIFNFLLYNYNPSGVLCYTNAPVYSYRICDGSLSHCMNYRSETFQRERLENMLSYVQESIKFLDDHKSAGEETRQQIGKGITQFAATALLCALRCKTVNVSDVQKRLRDIGVYPYKLRDYFGSLNRAVKLFMTNWLVIKLIDKTKILQRKTVQE
jgi:glycosyltransferase involved in cell wall biosynthesis